MKYTLLITYLKMHMLISWFNENFRFPIFRNTPVATGPPSSHKLEVEDLDLETDTDTEPDLKTHSVKKFASNLVFFGVILFNYVQP